MARDFFQYLVKVRGVVVAAEFAGGLVLTCLDGAGTVTLPNRARNKSAGMLGSRRSDDVAPRLHRRGPEGSVRFCGGEMAFSSSLEPVQVLVE